MATQVRNTRLLRDYALVTTNAIPGTSSNATTSAIDLAGVGPYQPEEITVEIAVPKMTAHVTAANVLAITLYHGDTSSLASTSVALGLVITCSQIGIATDGTELQVWRYRLPPGTKRYIGWYMTTGITDSLDSYTATFSLLV
jgi:hypothetical protein